MKIRTAATVLAALMLGTMLGGCGLSENDKAVCAAARTKDAGNEDAAKAIYGAPKADSDKIRTQQERIKLGSTSSSDNDAIAKIKAACPGG